MKARIYTYLYRYAGENTWYDIEMDYTEEEIEQKLRQLRKDYPTMSFRKKFIREEEIQVLTARTPGTYVSVKVEEKKNWAGQKYLTFSTSENGKVAEVDIYKDHFRIYGYKTDIYDTRKSRIAAIHCAKWRVLEFFAAIGESRPLVFC